MSTVRVGIDVDGVLANWNIAQRELLAKLTGRRPDLPDDWEPPCWHWETTLGYTEAEIGEAWRNIRADGFFWTVLPPYPGVFPFLDWLWREVSTNNWTQGTSHEVYFITSRIGHRAKDQTENWLHRHGFKGKSPTVLMANDGKGRIAADLQLTHFLDDKPDNVEHVRAYHGRCRTCLLDRRWNKDHQSRCAAKGVTLVPTLKDFQTILSSEF